VHTPVKAGDCADCHDPHASEHGKLLEAEPERICAKCHGSMVPDKANSAHAAGPPGQVRAVP
jgi:predicted CXXCH cytochrome family protein